MADASGDGPVRELLRQFGLAAVGAASLTAERADRLAEELSRQGGMRKDDARVIIEEATARWRAEALRLGERASTALEGLWDELGLVSRERYEDLELRLAQLEHRMRLLEGDAPSTPRPSPEGTDPPHGDTPAASGDGSAPTGD